MSKAHAMMRIFCVNRIRLRCKICVNRIVFFKSSMLWRMSQQSCEEASILTHILQLDLHLLSQKTPLNLILEPLITSDQQFTYISIISNLNQPKYQFLANHQRVPLSRFVGLSKNSIRDFINIKVDSILGGPPKPISM